MNRSDIEALLTRFIDVPSISGDEVAYATIVSQVLAEKGYDVEHQAVAGERFNVLASARDKSLLLCTHLDTVPPFFPSRVESDAVFGRGACDTKGIFVAMLAAADRLRAEGIDDFGFLMVVGEEVDGIGAQVANETCRAPYVVVGEPTENKLAVGHQGALKFRVEATGVSGHSAYPETGHSAIHELTGFLHALQQEDWGYDRVLGRATFNAGVIEGGHAANVIADRARAECMLRLVTDPQPVQQRILELLPERTAVEWIAVRAPSRMVEVPGFETCAVRFSTDIPYLPDVGSPLLYGPGSIRHAHTADEHITFDSHRASHPRLRSHGASPVGFYWLVWPQSQRGPRVCFPWGGPTATSTSPRATRWW